MKYAHLIIGLLAGTAIGGSVVASTGAGIVGGSADPEAVRAIVREVIMAEPKLIMDSVQKFQMDQQKQAMSGANEALKDEAVKNQIFNDPTAGSVGPRDSKRVVAEFFDYNCGACKNVFKEIEKVVKKDPSVRVVFHEYPIFGPMSDANAKIGIAVNRLYPEKYFDFHTKMITHEGRVDEKVALGYVKDLGMDANKVKAETTSKEVGEILEANRKLGEKLQVRGTPTMVFLNEVVPHGMDAADLEARLASAEAGDEPAQ
jgi:protein-disulfide isomerase